MSVLGSGVRTLVGTFRGCLGGGGRRRSRGERPGQPRSVRLVSVEILSGDRRPRRVKFGPVKCLRLGTPRGVEGITIIALRIVGGVGEDAEGEDGNEE